jgi:hypothetical protein
MSASVSPSPFHLASAFAYPRSCLPAYMVISHAGCLAVSPIVLLVISSCPLLRIVMQSLKLLIYLAFYLHRTCLRRALSTIHVRVVSPYILSLSLSIARSINTLQDYFASTAHVFRLFTTLPIALSPPRSLAPSGQR